MVIGSSLKGESSYQYSIVRETRVDEGDNLLRNDERKFVDVIEAAGIYSS